MIYTDLQIGTKLELEVFNIMGERVKRQLISQLEWTEEDNVAFMAAPIHEGVIFPVRIGAAMNVYCLHNGDLYKFRAKVMNRGVKDNIALLKTEITGEFEKIQRRQFFRFECSTAIKYRPETAEEEEKAKEPPPFIKTYTRDLSGGGLCMVTENRLELGQAIECELSLDEGASVKFKGTVVRSDRIELDERDRFEAGIRFDKIDNRDREAVIAFIFREQRKLRKKGLI